MIKICILNNYINGTKISKMTKKITPNPKKWINYFNGKLCNDGKMIGVIDHYELVCKMRSALDSFIAAKTPPEK